MYHKTKNTIKERKEKKKTCKYKNMNRKCVKTPKSQNVKNENAETRDHRPQKGDNSSSE